MILVTNSDEVRIVDNAEFKSGDTVTVTKDLNVKGASFFEKSGTTLRNINLTDDPKHIEGQSVSLKLLF